MGNRKICFVWDVSEVERLLARTHHSKGGGRDISRPAPVLYATQKVDCKTLFLNAGQSPAKANAYSCHPSACMQKVERIRRVFTQVPGVCSACQETRRVGIQLDLSWRHRSACGCVSSEFHISGCSLRTSYRVLNGI